MHLSTCDVGPEIVRLGPYTVRRGVRLADREHVLIVSATRRPSARSDIEGLERQFALLEGAAVTGVPRALELIREGADAHLVLTDAGLLPLSSVAAARRLDLPAWFRAALAISAVVAELHHRRITHGALTLDAILVSPDFETVQLLHTGALSSLPAGGAGVTAGTSPEQTGRINRAVDYRTDFYSLGALFFQLLTGVPPFAADDPLELVHAHIARTPPSPSERDATVPEPLSRIVLKLLAKAPEDRYQSAGGLILDLERCQRDWLATGAIASFEPGENDVPDRIIAPGRLYGRDREVRALLRAFEQTCEGASSLLLVGGYSGIGKTSLIQELYKPIIRQRGYFISGKFDQIVRNIPYGALAQALRSLVWQLLTEPEERLAIWRTRLTDALGANVGVLAEVVPEIELVVGRQPPPPPLEPTEARNRFGYVFQCFVGTLARREHPLVIFLDDLQWVDAATLDLLHSLLTSAEIRHLLLIGAFRDNEVDHNHILTWTVERLQASGAAIARLALGPLGFDDLTHFLCDTLHADAASVEPLARLIDRKTGGNPFFVFQFLKTLERERLLTFDPARARWQFDLAAIAAAGMTDNVVDLMAGKIRHLSIGAQEALMLAACIGGRFETPTLATVSRQDSESLSAGLAEAVQEGLIEPAIASPGVEATAQRGEAYEFLHDRIQQAAYDLIPGGRKKSVHLEVGRLLLGKETEVADDRLFAVLNHLNIGSRLIDDPAEKRAVARLNLAAGRKAKSAAAYRAAGEYLAQGIALLDPGCWPTDYDLMWPLHLEAAEVAYLSGSFERAEQSLQQLLEWAAAGLDRAQVHGLRMTLYENQSRWVDAVHAGADGLAQFDIALPRSPVEKQAALEEALETVQGLVGDRAIASLVALPEMSDPRMRMVLRLLTVCWAPAYISGDETLARLISATIVRLSLLYGNTEDSAYGYVTHAITIGPVRGDYRSAFEWGDLALQVNRQFDDLKRRAKIHQQFQAHVNLWCRPFETCIPHAREATQSGLQAGDFTYAGYGAATEAWSALLVNRDLDRFVRDYSPTLVLLERIKMGDFLAAHQLVLNWARALQGRTAGPLSLSSGGFDEARYIERYQHTAPFFLTFVYAARLHLALLLGEYVEAGAAAASARDVAVNGTIWPVLIDVWSGLAAGGEFDTASPVRRPACRDYIVAMRDRLTLLAETCPANFRGWWLLLDAESARTAGRTDDAAEAADAAVTLARETRNLQLEALASEVQARVAFDRGDDERFRESLQDTYRCYQEWGATAKLAQLERRYGPLVARPSVAVSEMPPAIYPQPAVDPAALDLTTVLRVAHAIAVEIETGSLLEKVMRLALENAGADRGLFVQEREGRLQIHARAVAGGDPAGTQPPVALDEAVDAATSVVRYVERTRQDVVVGDAATDERFAGDPYIEQSGVKSILCVPVGHQGRPGGILYLENRLTTEAFTPARLETMRILAAQAAISLENARLYEEMKNEVARRSAAELALRAALADVEALTRRLEAENVYLQEEIRLQHNFNEIVGNSPPLLSALRRVERVAPTDSTVLIVGETGCGKELFARAVHNRSRRANRPLVKVNCGAIAPGLVESELFGHVKGAFTGAIEKRVGRFEVADGGTIFLDEIGELPLEAQVKLLRVLQEQEFEPVGSSRTIRVSVRVIAATNRDLQVAVQEGKFRADLLYRLNVFPIEVPSLRDRGSDIGLLIAFFSTALSRKLGKPIHGVSAGSLRRMEAYGWPGNVRELQNVIERAAILAQTPILDLETGMFGEGRERPGVPDPEEEIAATVTTGSLEDVQRLHILGVLKSTGGVVEGSRGAASILGLHPNTLRSRMKKLGIPTSRKES